MKIKKLTKKEVLTLVAVAGTGILIGMLIRQLSPNANTDYMSDNKLNNILDDLIDKGRLALHIDTSVPNNEREIVLRLLDEVKILSKLLPKH